jgi:hypothetical protein
MPQKKPGPGRDANEPDDRAVAPAPWSVRPNEKFCGKPMPGTANCRELGKWGCIMISLPSASVRRGASPLDGSSVPATAPCVLGTVLNCSESCWSVRASSIPSPS